MANYYCRSCHNKMNGIMAKHCDKCGGLLVKVVKEDFQKKLPKHYRN